MKPVRIMVVEDEFIVAERLVTSLENLGYEVVARATTGKQAIELACSSHPDIIIMDIKLEGEIDGIDAAHIIRTKHNIPIIFLTGYTEKELFERAKFTHPENYLTKPFNEAELYRAIELALLNKQPDKLEKQAGCRLSNTLFVKNTQNHYSRIEISDIVYVEADGGYSIIVTTNGNLTVSGNLKSIEEKISNPSIIRVHRSYLVNLAYVQQLIGKTAIVLKQTSANSANGVTKTEKKIPVGPEYAEYLQKTLKFI